MSLYKTHKVLLLTKIYYFCIGEVWHNKDAHTLACQRKSIVYKIIFTTDDKYYFLSFCVYGNMFIR